MAIQRKRIIVTGANGQLGKEIESASNRFDKLEFSFHTRETLSIGDEAAVRRIFNEYQPDFCINCAAYTAVDKAESEKEEAIAINADAVGSLARESKRTGAKFLHLSTDYVFDGTGSIPYTEDDAPNPMTVYGASKLAGERMAIAENDGSIVIRTSWVYSEFGKNFVKTMLRLMNEKEEIGVVNDQRGCPTYANDLAVALLQIIDSGNWVPGIYHYCNDGVITWHQFAEAIREISGSKCLVKPISSGEFKTAAKRPAYSALNNQKVQQVFGVSTGEWRKSLSRCLSRLK